jgi:hypothetical protein
LEKVDKIEDELKDEIINFMNIECSDIVIKKME